MTTEASGPGMDQGRVAGVGDSLRKAGDGIASAALGQAESVAEGTKQAGVEQVRHVVQAAERAADDLQQQSPLLADYIRDAAHKIEDMGEALRERTVGDMLSAATDYGRKQPLLFLAGAAVLGFALSRFVRSGLSPSSSGTAADREADTKYTGFDV